MGAGPIIALISLLAVFSLIALAIFGSSMVSSSVEHECPKCRKKFLTESDLNDHTKKMHRGHLKAAPDIHKAA